VSRSVSVALCTYNGAAYLGDQLRSILEQSVPPAEIVIADDGSTDGTLELIEGVIAAGPAVSIRLLRGVAPLGVTRNFERAIRATTGDLVVLCDQDDVWHPDRVAVALRDFEASPGLLLWHSDARLVDGAGADLGFGLFESLALTSADIAEINDGDALAVYIRRNLVTGATAVIDRRLLSAALPFPDAWVHDEWLGAIAAATGRVHVSTTASIDYRQHSTNQIGVVRPTLRHRIGRMLEPRGDRYAILAARAEALVRRLETVGDHPAALRLAERKLEFEVERARYPQNRLARVRPVLRRLRSGSYRELSSQGTLDVVRDIIQPA